MNLNVKHTTMFDLDIEPKPLINLSRAHTKLNLESRDARSAESSARRPGYTTPATPSCKPDNSMSYRRREMAPSVRPAEPLDFNKFTSYNWSRLDAGVKLPHVAPDKVYKHTYGTADADRMEIKISMPHISNKKTPGGGQDRSPARANAKVSSQETDIATNSRRLLDRLHELQCLDDDLLLIRPFGSSNETEVTKRTRKRMDDPDILYSEVKKSIQLFYNVTRHLDIECHHAHRPLKKEQGRYRPFSKTIVPSALPKISGGGCRKNSAKHQTSSEAYVKYLEDVKSTAIPNQQGGHIARANTVVTDYFHPDGLSRSQTEMSMDTLATRGTPQLQKMGLLPARGARPNVAKAMGITGHGIPLSESMIRRQDEAIPEWAANAGDAGDEAPVADNAAAEVGEEMLDSVGIARGKLTVDLPSAEQDNDQDQTIIESVPTTSR